MDQEFRLIVVISKAICPDGYQDPRTCFIFIRCIYQEGKLFNLMPCMYQEGKLLNHTWPDTHTARNKILHIMQTTMQQVLGPVAISLQNSLSDLIVCLFGEDLNP